MEVIRGINQFRPEHRPCVLSIGNFDGVHLGHQTVIRFLAEKGRDLGIPVGVLTFEPHPKEFFVPEFAPPRVFKLRDKITKMARLDVDRLFLLKFNQKLAYLPPEDFIQKVIVDGLGVKYLVVGDDFRFGFERRGDFAMLESAGKEFGFQVSQMPTHQLYGSRVSSSRVRKALLNNDLNMAARLLGSPYRISGRVIHGDQLAQQLEYPTANIKLPLFPMPVAGVYLVEVFGAGPRKLQGVANVGSRPTVAGKRKVLEVHLLDFSADLYGQYLEIDFLKHIREEIRFESLQELKCQIAEDINTARNFFS